MQASRDRAIEILGDCADVFGDRAQAVAAQLFDEVCEAEGIDATARMFDDVIDRDVMAGKVRYYAGSLAGDEPDVVSFERMVSQLGGYYARRSAWANTLRNCERGKVRYARVPGGGETCQWCMMLAGRGFVYHSEASALSGSHGYHRNCDCVAIPGRRGRTAIEGYDPDACRLLAERFEQIGDRRDITGAQKEALKAAWSSALIGEDTAGLRSNPRDVARLYDDGLSAARKAFRRDKTADGYEENVNRYLAELGELYGLRMSGGTRPTRGGRECSGACPNGEEMWAALKSTHRGSSVVWIPETNAHRTPDMSVDGVAVEIKTPRSASKVGRLANEAAGKRYDEAPYGDGSRNLVMSLLNIGDGHRPEVAHHLDGFVRDGVLDHWEIAAP